MRGRYEGNEARLAYSLDGREYVDTGCLFALAFGQWKGARVGLFSFGPAGKVDVDSFKYRYGAGLGGAQ